MLSPALNEMLFAIGCGDRVVLRDTASDYPPEVSCLPATDPFHLSLEYIAGFRPDLVLLSHGDVGRSRGLRALGLRTLVLDPRRIEDVLETIDVVGRLCGASARARTLVVAIRRRIDAVRTRLAGRSRPSVYVELDGSDPSRPWTIGGRSFVDDVVTLAGGQTIFSTIPRGAFIVSAEAVIEARPQHILLNVPLSAAQRARQAVLERPGWQSVPAVRSRQIIADIDQAVLTRPGPRVIDGIERLATILHLESRQTADAR